MIQKIEDQYKERIGICRQCENWKEEYNRCRICGCFLTIKARIPIFSCPLKKWESYKL